MAAATVRWSIFTGASEGAGVSAETGGVANRDDTLTGTTPVPIPTAPGTNFSNHKNLAAEVTFAGTTNISNLRVRQKTANPTGVQLFFKPATTFAQSAVPSAGVGSGAVPAGYTLLTQSFQQYDNGSYATGTLGRKGKFCQVVIGVDDTAVGLQGTLDIPDLEFEYDEQ